MKNKQGIMDAIGKNVADKYSVKYRRCRYDIITAEYFFDFIGKSQDPAATKKYLEKQIAFYLIDKSLGKIGFRRIYVSVFFGEDEFSILNEFGVILSGFRQRVKNSYLK